MAKLSDLGFLKGVIAETIVSTYTINGKPNAAPMGVVMNDEQHLIINLFNSSITCTSIQANRCAVVNLTNNIEVYYKTAFKEVNQDGLLSQEWFEKSKRVNAPKLSMAEATIDVSLNDLTPFDTEKMKAFFTVESVQAVETYPQVYCRAFSATIEAIIHATRIKALANKEQEEKHVLELIKKVESCYDVVNRVAPNSQFSSIMADLTRRINSWEQK